MIVGPLSQLFKGRIFYLIVSLFCIFSFNTVYADELYELIRYTDNSSDNLYEIEKIDLRESFSKENLINNFIVLTIPTPVEKKYLLISSDIKITTINSEQELVTVSGYLYNIDSIEDARIITQSTSRPLFDGEISINQLGSNLYGEIDISSYPGIISITNQILKLKQLYPDGFCGADELEPEKTPIPTPTPTIEPVPPDDGPGTTDPDPDTGSPGSTDQDSVDPDLGIEDSSSPISTEEQSDNNTQPRSNTSSFNNLNFLRQTDSNQTELDLLIVYTPDVMAAAGSHELIKVYSHSLVEQVNNFLRNSRVATQLRLVGVEKLSEAGSGIAITDLNSLTILDGIWDEVHNLRNIRGADIVTMLQDNYLRTKEGPAGRALCGIGWIPKPGTPAWASDISFNIVSALFSDDSLGACGARVLAHEIGHNLGLDHDKNHSVGGGAYPDSHGNRFRVNSSLLATIMSYLDPEDTDGRFINYFSNSEILFDGIASGIEGEADEAASLNRVVDFASRHRNRQFINISGRVTDGIDGVSAVNILIDAQKYGISGPDGRFSIVSPRKPSSKISVQSTGREFSPSELVLDSNQDTSDIQFIVSKDLGSPLPGYFRVSLGTLFAGKEIEDVTYYVNDIKVKDKDLFNVQFIDILQGRAVTIRAIHPIFDLIPSQFVIPAINRNESRVFQAEEGKQWITGRITSSIQNSVNEEKSISGVDISGSIGLRGDDSTNHSITSLDGFYRFRNAQIGSKYYLTPSHPNYHFFPPVGNVAPSASITVFNFNGLEGPGVSLSGVVRDQLGDRISNAALILSCTHKLGEYVIENLSSDEQGNFIFIGLPVGSKCSLNINKRGYTFEGQASINIDNDSELNPTLNRNFFRVLGLIRDDTGSPLNDVLLSTLAGTYYSDTLGRYSIEITSGNSQTIVPVKANYFFDPPYCDAISKDGSDQSCDFKATAINDSSTPFKILGSPKIISGGGSNGEIQIKINYITSTGIKPEIQWQIRKRVVRNNKKRWAPWKKIKGATDYILTLKSKAYLPGKYQVRVLIRADELFRSKPTTLEIKRVKKGKKSKKSNKTHH